MEEQTYKVIVILGGGGGSAGKRCLSPRSDLGQSIFDVVQ